VWIAATALFMRVWLIRHDPAAKLAPFTFLTPIFGVVGWLAPDDPPTIAT